MTYTMRHALSDHAPQTRTRTATSVPVAIAADGQHSSTHPSWNICHRRSAAAAHSNVLRPSPSRTRLWSTVAVAGGVARDAPTSRYDKSQCFCDERNRRTVWTEGLV